MTLFNNFDANLHGNPGILKRNIFMKQATNQGEMNPVFVSFTTKDAMIYTKVTKNILMYIVPLWLIIYFEESFSGRDIS